MDLPTYLEANVITTTAIKVAWVFCYILVYGLRPVIVRPKKVGEQLLLSSACTVSYAPSLRMYSHALLCIALWLQFCQCVARLRGPPCCGASLRREHAHSMQA